MINWLAFLLRRRPTGTANRSHCLKLPKEHEPEVNWNYVAPLYSPFGFHVVVYLPHDIARKIVDQWWVERRKFNDRVMAALDGRN